MLANKFCINFVEEVLIITKHLISCVYSLHLQHYSISLCVKEKMHYIPDNMKQTPLFYYSIVFVLNILMQKCI